MAWRLVKHRDDNNNNSCSRNCDCSPRGG